jgi:hypothetical protein
MPFQPLPAHADAVLRAAVLRHLIDLYPAWLTADEATRAVGSADASAARRALRDLEADGLLHRRDDFVLPSRAAVACAALLGELSS